MKGVHKFCLFLFLLSPFLSFGQRNCGNDTYYDLLRSENPNFDTSKDKIFQKALKFKESAVNALGAEKDPSVVYTIPVVVHVLYNTSVQNISDGQILSQIAVLNEDYRRQNSDASSTPSAFAAIAGDAEIEFCLATVDPNGNPTTGITRKNTSVSSFSVSTDNIKVSAQGGQSPWPTADYMNIWVGPISGGTLGYATPPFGASPGSRDGVVIGYQYMGNTGTAVFPYNEGRTATHEVGHYLGLPHIWADGSDNGGCSFDDGISDTPLQSSPYGGCPSYPSSSCGSSDMFMNFLDYVDDRCMNSFSNGQIAVMRGVLTGFRSNLLSSSACGGTSVPCVDISTSPLIMGFESSEDFSTWNVENVNGDVDGNGNAVTWVLGNDQTDFGPKTGSQMMMYFWNSNGTTGANDYLFSPCFDVIAGHQYQLELSYACASFEGTVFPEKLSIGFSETGSSSDFFVITPDWTIDPITNAYPNYQTFSRTFNANSNGSFSLGLHCFSDADRYALQIDDINITDITSVGTQNLDPAAEFSLYPNPAHHQFMIQMDHSQQFKSLDLEITDVAGKTLMNQRIDNPFELEQGISVAHLSAGVYFVTLRTEDGIQTEKLVVSQ